MKFKGGDSNKKFQKTFFKPPAQCKGVNKEFQTTENRNKFWPSQNNCPRVTNPSDEATALNVIALMSAFKIKQRG
jgi:hypothetical protein